MFRRYVATSLQGRRNMDKGARGFNPVAKRRATQVAETDDVGVRVGDVRGTK